MNLAHNIERCRKPPLPFHIEYPLKTKLNSALASPTIFAHERSHIESMLSEAAGYEMPAELEEKVRKFRSPGASSFFAQKPPPDFL